MLRRKSLINALTNSRGETMAGKSIQDKVMDIARAFQPAGVLIAAAELDIFTLLKKSPMTCVQAAARIGADQRGIRILLDALVAMGLLRKRGATTGVYTVPAGAAAVLSEGGAECMLGMVRHLGTCMKKWSQLAVVAKTGKSAGYIKSVRGESGDLDSFIRAMDEISEQIARPLIKSLGNLNFRHVLDLGGASGTWTRVFLDLYPDARATIFDLPEVIPMARRNIGKAGIRPRVRLVAGNYLSNTYPTGCDLAWFSAIIHQHSRKENRSMFKKAFAALNHGGKIMVREVILDESRTRPAVGALFAVNMLTATSGGDVFTFKEIKDDLISAGFNNIRIIKKGSAMDTVICGTKPA